MPPKGAWKPSLNLSQVLQQIRVLLEEPNPDDPLMPDITNLYLSSRELFNKKATEWTKAYASDTQTQAEDQNSTLSRKTTALQAKRRHNSALLINQSQSNKRLKRDDGKEKPPC